MSELNYEKAKAAIEAFENEYIGQDKKSLWELCVSDQLHGAKKTYNRLQAENEKFREAILAHNKEVKWMCDSNQYCNKKTGYGHVKCLDCPNDYMIDLLRY